MDRGNSEDPPARKILVCGSRNWTDEETIRSVLSTYPSSTVVVHGACNLDLYRRTGKRVGADLLAEKVAIELGMEVIPYPADWKLYGKAAGPIRNQQMLDREYPDEVLGFIQDTTRARGTLGMLKLAKARGKPCRAWRPTSGG